MVVGQQYVTVSRLDAHKSCPFRLFGTVHCNRPAWHCIRFVDSSRASAQRDHSNVCGSDSTWEADAVHSLTDLRPRDAAEWLGCNGAVCATDSGQAEEQAGRLEETNCERGLVTVKMLMRDAV